MLGVILKKLRKKKKMTQEELGKIIGVSGRNIGYYESNERVPPADVLKKLAEFFNVTTDYLLGQTDIPDPKLRLSKDQLPKELQGLDIEYITLARELQEGDFSPEDIRMIIRAVEAANKRKKK